LHPEESFEDLNTIMKQKDSHQEILDQIIDEVRCYEDIDRSNLQEIFSLIRSAFQKSQKFDETSQLLQDVKTLL